MDTKSIANIISERPATAAAPPTAHDQRQKAALENYRKTKGADLEQQKGAMLSALKTVKFGVRAATKKDDTPERSARKKFLVAAMKRGLRVSLQVTKLGTSATINAATLDLPFDTIADAVFIALDTAVFVGGALKKTVELFKALQVRDLFTALTTFTGGPEAVADGIDKVFMQLASVSESGAQTVRDFVSRINDAWDHVVEGTAPLLASMIALVIPSDFGVSRPLIENFTLAASSLLKNSDGFKPYSILRAMFAALPNVAREFLMDKERLGNMLRAFVAFVRKLLPPRNASLGARATAAAKRAGLQTLVLAPLVVVGVVVAAPLAPLILAGAAGVALTGHAANAAITLSPDVSESIGRMIDEEIEPRVDILVDAIHAAMALSFGFLYIMETKRNPAQAVEETAK